MVTSSPKLAPIDVALGTAWSFARRATSFVTGGRYDAARESKRRKSPDGHLSSEDDALPPEERRKLIAAGRDIHRNFAIAGWMIRKHLDYVSNFTFQCRSGNPDVDVQVEKLMRWWMNPANCDVTGRHSLQKMIRLGELRRTIDGDIFFTKLRDGRLQAIEGDRVRTPAGGVTDGTVANSDLVHGVQVNPAGRALRYCVCKRGKGANTFTFERMVPASNLYHFAYFDRFDQVRGISPLAAGINSLRDTYEGFDYALAKLKVAQLFGLTFYRERPQAVGNVTTSEDDGSGYEVDFGAGPVVLDLDAGDRAEFLENKTPSTEFQSFTQSMIGVALKALDIPFSFYDESFTNYSGARQAMLQYELSAQNKRAEVQALLDHLTAWRISLWIQDGLLNTSLGDLTWSWIPNGIGWIDPLKEVDANIAAINAGLDTRTRILREQGRDFFEVADELAVESKYLSDLQLAPVVGAENRQPIVEVAKDAAA